MKKKPGSMAGLALLSLAGFLPGCLYVSTGSTEGDLGKSTIQTHGLGASAPARPWTEGAPKGSRAPVTIRSDTYTKLAEKVNPAVVSIFTSQKIEAGIGVGILALPLPDLDLRAQGLGSGFLISEDGFLLTNYHVIADAVEIQVFLDPTGEVQPSQVVGVDPLTDIALLKITSGKKLPFLPLADSDSIEIGEPVIAVGNPFGLSHSLTTGVISAKNRTLSPGTQKGNFEQYLQTSALINPGNSGGPLVDLEGEAVGINTSIVANAQGIGFAIPSNLVKELMPELARNGRIERGYFGIAVTDLSPALAARFKLDPSQKEGVLVARTDRQGPAAKAGLAPGDIVVSLDGVKVANAQDCARKISHFPPGRRVRVEVLRSGQPRAFDVTAQAL